MGFFKDIGEGILSGGKFVLGPALKLREAAMNLTDKLGGAAGNIVDKAGGAAGNVLDGIGGLASLFGNPLVWVAVGVGAFIILPRILK